jgi:acyl-CoA-dependent ceramide synthase
MSDPSAIAAIQNEKASPAHEWIEENDENANGMEKKLNDSISQAYPARTVVINRKVKRKDDGPLELICGWIVEHQIGMINSSYYQLQSSTNAILGLAVNLLMLLFLTHLSFPRARRHTRKFFELSYFNPESGEYCAGWNDAWMVFYWIIVFTGLRAAVMDYLLTPFAKKAGAKTERDQTRFAEQAWLLIYYSVFWTLGMVRRSSLKHNVKI